MKLSFIIPTYNRPRELEICVKSLAAQIRRADVQIIVIGETEENGNKEVCERMQKEIPFLQVIHHEHSDYSENFRAMFRAAAESEWAWTFGDDDILHPGALDFMLKRIEEHPEVSFYHVAEESRASGRGAAATGTLYDLCCEIGWIEMTGFISGNVVRGSMLAAAAETPRWHNYAKCSFVQSCALLEQLKTEQAAFIDLPLIKTQAKDQTPDSLQTWISQRIAERYLFISLAVERMVEDGILPVELPPKFFRYLNYHLWDRFITHFIGDYLDREQTWIDDAWANVMRFANFIAEPDASALRRDVEATRGMITLHSYMKRNVDGINAEIAGIGLRRGEAVYPYSFIPSRDAIDAQSSVSAPQQPQHLVAPDLT